MLGHGYSLSETGTSQAGQAGRSLAEPQTVQAGLCRCSLDLCFIPPLAWLWTWDRTCRLCGHTPPTAPHASLGLWEEKEPSRRTRQDMTWFVLHHSLEDILSAGTASWDNLISMSVGRRSMCTGTLWWFHEHCLETFWGRNTTEQATPGFILCVWNHEPSTGT